MVGVRIGVAVMASISWVSATPLSSVLPDWSLTPTHTCICRADVKPSICSLPFVRRKCAALHTLESCEAHFACDWIGDTFVSFESRRNASFYQIDFDIETLTLVDPDVLITSYAGFGLANVLTIESATGIVIVDTMGSQKSATVVAQRIAVHAQTVNKPVVAIIITHHHIDHLGGLGVFRNVFPTAQVYVNSAAQTANEQSQYTGQSNYFRSMRQFGALFTETTIADDIGADSVFLNQLAPGIQWIEFDPVAVYREGLAPSLDTALAAGVPLSLAGLDWMVHASVGESPDQLFLHLPIHNVILAADTIYAQFPNVFALRGRSRNPLAWMFSIDKMRVLNPSVLVLGHGRMVRSGVSDILTQYRDGLQYLNDYVVRRLNNDKTVNAIVESFDLPPHLKDSPFLQFGYGEREHQVRGAAAVYVGWFSGDMQDLTPIKGALRGQFFMEMINGSSRLNRYIRVLIRRNTVESLGFALELVESARQTHNSGVDHWTPSADELYAVVLERLAFLQTSTSSFFYHLTRAAEVRGDIVNGLTPFSTGASILRMDLKVFILSLLHGFWPSNAFDVNLSLMVTVDGTPVSIRVRSGVLETFIDPPAVFASSALPVSISLANWKRIFLQQANALMLYQTGEITGTMPAFQTFGAFLQRFADRSDLL